MTFRFAQFKCAVSAVVIMHSRITGRTSWPVIKSGANSRGLMIRRGFSVPVEPEMVHSTFINVRSFLQKLKHYTYIISPSPPETRYFKYFWPHPL